MKRFIHLALQKRLAKINVKTVFKNNSQIILPKDINFTIEEVAIFLLILMAKLKLFNSFV